MRKTHKKDPPRIRRAIKNTNQNYLSWLLGNEVPGRGGALKSHEIKYFYELEKEERNEKSLKVMIKSLKNIMQYKSKENMDYRRLFCRCCDSNFFEIIHHAFEFIIVQHHYIIIGYFWFLILSYGIYRWPISDGARARALPGCYS